MTGLAGFSSIASGQPAMRWSTAGSLPDEKPLIVEALKAWIAQQGVDVVIATGGTGVTGRDVTPEAFEAGLRQGDSRIRRAVPLAVLPQDRHVDGAVPGDGGRCRRDLSLCAARFARCLQGCLGRHPGASARLPLRPLQFRRTHAAPPPNGARSPQEIVPIKAPRRCRRHLPFSLQHSCSADVETLTCLRRPVRFGCHCIGTYIEYLTVHVALLRSISRLIGGRCMRTPLLVQMRQSLTPDVAGRRSALSV